MTLNNHRKKSRSFSYASLLMTPYFKYFYYCIQCCKTSLGEQSQYFKVILNEMFFHPIDHSYDPSLSIFHV